jgi:hypothetical protein
MNKKKITEKEIKQQIRKVKKTMKPNSPIKDTFKGMIAVIDMFLEYSKQIISKDRHD